MDFVFQVKNFWYFFMGGFEDMAYYTLVKVQSWLQNNF